MTYYEELKLEFKRVHGCVAEFLYAVPVHPAFASNHVWNGAVWLFKLVGHPAASFGYAWLHPNRHGDGLELLTVPEIFPESPALQTVRALIGGGIGSENFQPT